MDQNLNEAATSEATTSQSQDQNSQATQNWKTLLADEYKENPSLKDFKDLNDLAKSYVNAKSYIGGSIRIPSNDASDEAKEEFYKKLESVPGVVRFNEDDPKNVLQRLGLPEAPDKYEIILPEEVKANIQPELYNQFLSYAHELGLTKKQVQGMVDYEIKKEQAMNSVLETYVNEQETTLKKEWGNEFKNRNDVAKQTFDILSQKFPELKELNDNPKTAMNAGFVKLLYEIGKTYAEDKTVVGINDKRFGVSPVEAKSQISDIRNNKSHPYHDASHPEHETAKQKVNDLYMIAYGDEGSIQGVD
jgi:hypothetical protein